MLRAILTRVNALNSDPAVQRIPVELRFLLMLGRPLPLVFDHPGNRRGYARIPGCPPRFRATIKLFLTRLLHTVLPAAEPANAT